MDKKARSKIPLGLLGSMLASLAIMLIAFYLVGYLAFNHNNTIGLTRLMSEMETNGIIKAQSELVESINSLQIPMISDSNTGFKWLNPVISALNMILGLCTSMISFLTIIITFVIGIFSIV